LKVWLMCSFLGWGDDLHKNKFIRVQMHMLPHCIYDVFIYKLSMELRKRK